MWTKRIATLLLAAMLTMPLAGCGIGKSSRDAAMSIHPAQLTEEEERMAQLLDTSLDSYRIFDFQMGNKPNDVQTVQTAIYELVDGEWKPLFLGQEAFLDNTGRIALSFGRLTEGVNLSVQSEGGYGTRSFTVEAEDDVSAMACLTAVLGETTTMEFDKEVPLVVQIATAKSEIFSTDVNSFYTPEQYEKRGYEHVYAITVMFSQKTPAELARETQKGNQ